MLLSKKVRCEVELVSSFGFCALLIVEEGGRVVLWRL